MASKCYIVGFILVSRLLFMKMNNVEAINHTEEINKLLQFIVNDPSKMCSFIQCGGPSSQAECSNGTIFMEEVGQFGCCGACVRFKQNGDTNCTGSRTEGYTTSNTSESESSGKTGTQTSAGMGVLYSHWCDFGLRCNTNSTCEQRLDEPPCKRMQDAYDNMKKSGSFIPHRDDYRWRPTCTIDGKFAEKQCKGPATERRCICVDPEGNTTYGRILPEQTELYNNMNCKCSREIWQTVNDKKNGRVSFPASVTLHCQENGNYEPLQCQDGFCLCMNPDTALPTVGLTVPISAMEKLPCFDKSVVGSQYLRRCESEYYADLKLFETRRKKGVINVQRETIARCDADGSYNGRQLVEEDNLFYCHDKHKLRLDKNYLAADSSSGCNCARDRQTFKDLGFRFPFKCAGSQGSYETILEDGDRAFCVDSDGVRSSPMVIAVYRKFLDCEKAFLCQAGDEDACDLVCMTTNTTCPNEYYSNYAPDNQ